MPSRMEDQNKEKENVSPKGSFKIKQEVVVIESDEEASDIKPKSISVGIQNGELTRTKSRETEANPGIVHIDTSDSSDSSSDSPDNSPASTPVHIVIYADAAVQTDTAVPELVVFDSASSSDTESDADDDSQSDNNEDIVVLRSNDGNHKSVTDPKTRSVFVDLVETSDSDLDQDTDKNCTSVQHVQCKNDEPKEVEQPRNECQHEIENEENRTEPQQNKEFMDRAYSEDNQKECARKAEELHVTAPTLSVIQENKIEDNKHCRANNKLKKKLKKLRYKQRQQTQSQKQLREQQEQQQKQLELQQQLLQKLKAELERNATKEVPRAKEKKQQLPLKQKQATKKNASSRPNLRPRKCQKKDTETFLFRKEMAHEFGPEVLKIITRDAKETLESWVEQEGTRCSNCGKDLADNISSQLNHAYTCKKHRKDFVDAYSVRSVKSIKQFTQASVKNGAIARTASVCEKSAYFCVWCSESYTCSESLVLHLKIHVMQGERCSGILNSEISSQDSNQPQRCKRLSDSIVNEKKTKRKKRVSM